MAVGYEGGCGMRYSQLKMLKKEYKEMIAVHSMTTTQFFKLDTECDFKNLANKHGITVGSDVHSMRTDIDNLIQQETKNHLKFWALIAIILAAIVGAVFIVVLIFTFFDKNRMLLVW